MTPMDEALTLMVKESVKQFAKQVTSIDISAPEALIGSVLAEDVQAKDELPPFRASVMDGYAISTSNSSNEFEIVGARSFAGQES